MGREPALGQGPGRRGERHPLSLLTLHVYAGTLGEGLRVFRFDPAAGFTLLQTLPLPAPAYLGCSDRRSLIYTVTHAARFDGRAGAGLVACHRDPASGLLTITSSCRLAATNAAYVSLDAAEKVALVAFTLGGAAGVVRLGPGGEATGPAHLVRHEGRTLVPLGALEGPKIPPLPPGYSVPHAAEATPDNRVLLVPDLGLDRLYLYRLDVDAARLAPAPVPWVAFPPGSGPRHLCFHPSGRVLYVLNELASTVSILDWPDGYEGPPRHVKEVSALPAGFGGRSAAADIHLHPSGRYLYASNRGHDSIAVFAVAAEGDLELLATPSCGGAHPRSFGLSPDGATMIVSNRDTANLVAFAVDPATGRIDPLGLEASVERAAGVLVRAAQTV